MAGSDISQTILTLGGVYVLVRYGFPDLWNKINPIPPITPPAPSLTLSKTSVTYLDTFDVSVVGLKPDTPAYYGWLSADTADIQFEKRVAIGHLYGVRLPFTFTEQVLNTTPAGDYFVYYDQTPFGGYYLSQRLTVRA